jgi:Tol biopolymer transport system component
VSIKLGLAGAAMTVILSFAPAQAAPPRNGVIAYSFVEQPDGTCDGCGDRPPGSGRSWIEIVHADATHRRRLPCTTGLLAACRDRLPRFSSDGKRLAILNNEEIVITGLHGEVARRIPASAGSMAWAPGGDRIAYTQSFLDSDNAVHHAVFVTRLGGSARPLAPAADADAFGLTWSARGVLAWERVDGRRGVYTSGPRGQDVHRILPAQDLPRLPRWSYDGRHLAYACGSALCAVRADGSGRRVLTRHCDMEFDPGGWMAWSPDGRYVACMSPRSGNLITVRLATQERRVVRKRPDSGDFLPTDVDWRPRGL